MNQKRDTTMEQKAVVIVGAGGKMGARAADKIGLQSGYRVLMCESNAGKAKELEGKGFTVTPLAEALGLADFVVLAVPDAVIGRIAREAVPQMKPGATLIMLDAAAAYIGELSSREGITQMIAHPCHPPFFTDNPTPEERRDYFGGIARQDLIVSLIEGSRESLEEGTQLCRAIFAPVGSAHEVTPQQFAFLEPAMSEMLIGTAARLMKEAVDEAIARGVPAAAARSFAAGHVQIALAIWFEAEKSPFSDAAELAMSWGMREIIRPDWKKAYEPETLRSAIRYMLHSGGEAASS
ncbi:MAG TPA: phosphogluconate dehydrogenase C-terminal domain-containing protein [Bryobacteraceae bacterium]|nr:phosphogluconate dehydrogenase C-terminal domain-containing protein [Bryobacteraceae bacterium]